MVRSIEYNVENLAEVVDFVKDFENIVSFMVQNRIIVFTKIDGTHLQVRPKNVVYFKDGKVLCCKKHYFENVIMKGA